MVRDASSVMFQLINLLTKSKAATSSMRRKFARSFQAENLMIFMHERFKTAPLSSPKNPSFSHFVQLGLVLMVLS
jgi:hypothetical protein